MTTATATRKTKFKKKKGQAIGFKQEPVEFLGVSVGDKAISIGVKTHLPNDDAWRILAQAQLLVTIEPADREMFDVEIEATATSNRVSLAHDNEQGWRISFHRESIKGADLHHFANKPGLLTVERIGANAKAPADEGDESDDETSEMFEGE